MPGASRPDFSGLGIAPSLLAEVYRQRFFHPTPIQEKAIPVGIENRDLVGIAQTGTGKTLAFGVPMIQRAMQTRGTGLVVLPTRELAAQVNETLAKLGEPVAVRSALVIGGASMGRQVAELRRQPRIVIGTPGRLIDHLDQRTLSLARVNTLVLDEADRMLDMGFAPQLKRILRHVPAERQTSLFSATMPPEVMNIARTFMRLPVQIEIVPPGTAATDVTHEVFVVPKEQKYALLLKVLSDYRGSILVFMRMKYGVKRNVRRLRDSGISTGELHSNRTPAQRRDALEGFKAGRYRVLVATDIAARGIDVTNIELVVNFDLPEQAGDYVHRIGRTGRAGAAGHAISFATPDERGEVQTIERLLRKTLPLSKLPESLPRPPAPPAAGQPRRDGGHPGHGRPARWRERGRPAWGSGGRRRR